jgi:hypothetical protein
MLDLAVDYQDKLWHVMKKVDPSSLLCAQAAETGNYSIFSSLG